MDVPLAAGPSDYVSLYDLILTHTWWEYRPSSVQSRVYHYLNLIEGTIWLTFAGLVAARFFRFRRSPLEVAYALAFVAFGLSDFREAYRLESWLLLFKGVNLVVLLWLRRTVIRHWYPASKIY